MVSAIQQCGMSRIYVWPLPLNPPPHPTPLKHQLWVPRITQQTPTGYLFNIRQCECSHAILSNHPTLSFPYSVQNFVVPVFVSFAALQVGSSVLPQKSILAEEHFLIHSSIPYSSSDDRHVSHTEVFTEETCAVHAKASLLVFRGSFPLLQNSRPLHKFLLLFPPVSVGFLRLGEENGGAVNASWHHFVKLLGSHPFFSCGDSLFKNFF